LLGRFREVMSRGYSPEPDPPLPVDAIATTCPESTHDDVTPSVVRAIVGDGVRQGIGILLPTFVRRCTPDEHVASLRRLLCQQEEVFRAHPELPTLLVVGMQWQSTEERSEAVSRLRQLAAEVPAVLCRFLGLALPGPGKNRTINAALRLTADLGLRGWLWVDDDVEFSDACLARLTTAFLATGGRGAFGARPVVRAGSDTRWTARVSWAKRITQLRRPYPNACCMLVEQAVLAGGIPKRRYSDDGFVFFRLLRPADPDPLRDLHIVEDATCFVTGEARPRGILRRWRRLIYSHLICLSEVSPAASRYYFSQMLFFGLWPLAPWDRDRGLRMGALRWCLKAGYFTWFCAEASLLFCRGLAGRPLRSVQW
jgi:hypothetical protein